jgi:hypothetical protein
MDLATLAANPQLTASLLVGVVLPTIVAFVTKKVASSQLKTLVLLVLSLASTTIYALLASGDVTLSGFINGFVTTFIAAVAAHKGALAPLGVTGSEGAIQGKFPGGLGSGGEGGGEPPEGGDGEVVDPLLESVPEEAVEVTE